ncbi:MAG: HD domain-containing protein [Oscillospiraceae bacterium]|nr:HD domain-containing protein [Oscillospiraceae bacterium]
MSNSTLTRIIAKNEEDANKTVANVMLITFGIFTAVFILNILGIFIVKMHAMATAYCISAVLLLLPKILNRVCTPSAKWLKYAYVVFSALFIFIVTVTLSHHVVVVYAYPIAIAGMYFSKRMTRFASVITLAVTSLGQLTSYFVKWCIDENFPSLYRTVIFSILPRALTLIAFAALLELLTVRTSKLLSEDAENYEKQLIYSRDMIFGFATLVENRDENTGGHIKRTSIYSRMLARKLKEKGLYSDIITEEYIECLGMVAPLHDVGKISIPDSVLCKPGKLTDEEFDIMRSHSAKGGEIIRETFAHIADESYREMAYEVARFHHEKWNGRGYPDKLSGEDIPLCARIMAVADVFDAVSEKRCYRDAMPISKCFEIIAEGSGRDFDPAVAEAFLEMREEITKIRESGDFTENQNMQ